MYLKWLKKEWVFKLPLASTPKKCETIGCTETGIDMDNTQFFKFGMTESGMYIFTLSSFKLLKYSISLCIIL